MHGAAHRSQSGLSTDALPSPGRPACGHPRRSAPALIGRKRGSSCVVSQPASTASPPAYEPFFQAPAAAEGPSATKGAARRAPSWPWQKQPWPGCAQRGARRNGKEAVVIGAGPAGSCAAMYLARRGFNVNVYERRAPPEVDQVRWL